MEAKISDYQVILHPSTDIINVQVVHARRNLSGRVRSIARILAYNPSLVKVYIRINLCYDRTRRKMTSQDGPDMTTLYDVILSKKAICLNGGTLWFNAGFVGDNDPQPLALRRGRTLHFVSQIIDDDMHVAFHTNLQAPPVKILPASTPCKITQDMVTVPDLFSEVSSVPRFSLYTWPKGPASLTSFVKTMLRDNFRSFLVDGLVVAGRRDISVITSLDNSYEDKGDPQIDMVQNNRAVEAVVFSSVSEEDHVVLADASDVGGVIRLGANVWATSQHFTKESFTRLYLRNKPSYSEWLERTISLKHLAKETQ